MTAKLSMNRLLTLLATHSKFRFAKVHISLRRPAFKKGGEVFLSNTTDTLLSVHHQKQIPS